MSSDSLPLSQLVSRQQQQQQGWGGSCPSVGNLSRDPSPSSTRHHPRHPAPPQEQVPRGLQGRTTSRDASPTQRLSPGCLSRDASPQARSLHGLTDSPQPLTSHRDGGGGGSSSSFVAKELPGWRARLQQPPRAPSKPAGRPPKEERLGPEIPKLTKSYMFIHPEENFRLVSEDAYTQDLLS